MCKTIHKPLLHQSTMDSTVIMVDMVIIGGGICGILAAKKCHDQGISYRLVEKEAILGGVWQTMANASSFLQAFEPNYRWDSKYRLNRDPLTKNSGRKVLEMLHKYADDHGIPESTMFRTEAVTVHKLGNEVKNDKYVYKVVVKSLETGKEGVLWTKYLCVTPGILTTQWTAEERGVKGLGDFHGKVTLAGRHEGVDSSVAYTNLSGKEVVILGSGAFAAEAMEAADRSGAKHITILGRSRYRWMLPFSRQYTITSFANAPLIPWSVKYRLALWYLRTFFYKPCGLQHWAPSGRPEQMDFSGQCNDAYFRLAHQGRLTCLIDGLDRVEGFEAVLKSGKRIRCDMLVIASGCKYNLEPSFLQEMGLGFKDLHNFAFLGPNPRIGCASDFVFAYVPFGPIKQLEMFFHSVACCERGLENDIKNVLLPTPLPNLGGGKASGSNQRVSTHYTFFEYRNWWIGCSRAREAKEKAMLDTLDVGKGFIQRILYRMTAITENLINWLGTVCLAAVELYRYPVYGPGVKDHHYRPQSLQSTKQA